MTVTYEEIIVSAIGEFGVSQFLMVLTIKLCISNAAFAMVMTSLTGAEPDWWLVTDESLTKGNTTSWQFKVCPSDINEGIIVYETNIQTTVSEWDLICDKAWIPRTIMTIQMAGVMIGASLTGQFADWFGRKIMAITTFVLILCSVLAQGFSTSWQMLAGFGFTLGYGIGGFLVCANVYYLEFVGTSWRTVTGSFPAWPIGVIILGIVFKLVKKWRYVCYANAAFGFPVLVLYRFCPESVRWLFTHGKTEEAKEALETLAYRNKLPTPDFREIDLKVQEDARNEENRKLKYNYCTLFSNKLTRWKMSKFGFIWFAISFCYYAITFGVGTFDGDPSIIMMLQGLLEAFSIIFLVLLAKITGRRFTSIAFFALTSFTLFAITVAFHTLDPPTYETSKTALALTAKFFLASSWSNLVLFTIETFPTVVRNTAFGLANVFARVGGILAPQNLALHEITSHLPFTTNGVLQLLCGFLCLTFRDTYSSELEDHFEEDEEHMDEEVFHTSGRTRWDDGGRGRRDSYSSDSLR